MKAFLFLIVVLLPTLVFSQVFEEGLVQSLTKKGADHVYNSNPDSAIYYADSIGTYLPNHPVVPLMKAMSLLWSSIPIISDSLFHIMERQLDSAILLASQEDPQFEDPEMIFFAMSAHGLLAEYYADRDYRMKAVGEASHAYGLLRKGFDLTDEYPEFLFTVGLYNYFREKYPEKHPLYRPLLWFFKGGDKELGLMQLKSAIDIAFLTKVEAHLYLSYIYLRYEYEPKMAQKYLSRLCLMYPNNYYAKAKYLESLANPKDYHLAPVKLISELIYHKSDYYKLAGYIFQGYREEVINNDASKAEATYRKGLAYGEEIPGHGEFFKGFGYLGLGRLLAGSGKVDEAKKALREALKYPETVHIEEEVKALLSQI